MKLIIPDNRIDEVWNSLKGKTYTELSYHQELYVKSNAIKFVKKGFIVIPKNIKDELWAQTENIQDYNERVEAYSVLIYKEYIRNESSRK